MPALDDATLDAIFREARSFNRYTDRPVTDDDLRAIWELMKWGPTSNNQLPARLVWVRTPEGKAKLAATAADSNAAKILAAPVTVIVGMDDAFHENLPWLFPHIDAKPWYDGDLDKRRQSAFRNSTLQGAYLIIAARALGLQAGPMSGFDNAAVDAAFFADTPTIRSNFIAMIGHGDPASLHPRLPRPEFDRFNTLA